MLKSHWSTLAHYYTYVYGKQILLLGCVATLNKLGIQGFVIEEVRGEHLRKILASLSMKPKIN